MRGRLRWLLLAMIFIAWVVGTTVIGFVAIVAVLSDYDSNARNWVEILAANCADAISRTDTWILLAVNVPIVIGTQVLFLLPVFRFDPELGGRKSLRLSMVVAGFGAAILTTGMLMGLVSLGQLLTGTLEEFPVTLYFDAEAAIFDDMVTHGRFKWIFVVSLVILMVSWLLWSLVMVLFVARRNVPGAIRRVTGLLVAGTLLEVLLVLPLEAMVRRRTDCYCGTGSFQMLLGAVLAGVWLMGPGIVVLLLLRRPAYWGRYCPGCGQEKGPRSTQPENCPECGRAWKAGVGPAG